MLEPDAGPPDRALQILGDSLGSSLVRSELRNATLRAALEDAARQIHAAHEQASSLAAENEALRQQLEGLRSSIERTAHARQPAPPAAPQRGTQGVPTGPELRGPDGRNGDHARIKESSLDGEEPGEGELGEGT